MRSTQKQNRGLKELKELSLSLSKQIIEITTEAGSGHPSSSLSAIDVLTCLYFKPVLNFDPGNSKWPDRDRFILSKGHGAPGLYATLANAGFFDTSLLKTLRKFGSPLEGHPNMKVLNCLEASTGSLGQGLSIGIGHALAGKIDNKKYQTYVMTGDGEMQEGQIWEGIMCASSKKLDNLTLIVDHNKYQQTNSVSGIMPSLYPLAEKFDSFGWYTEEIDGHDIEKILDAFETIGNIKGRPQVIIANTVKGKSLSPFTSEEKSHKHGKPLKPEQVETAISELEKQYK